MINLFVVFFALSLSLALFRVCLCAVRTTDNDGSDVGSAPAPDDLLFHDEKNLNGFISWVFIVVITFTSLEYFRRHHFRIFLSTHFFFVIFFAFAWLHTERIRPYLLVGAGIYAVDRLYRLLSGLLPTRVKQVTVVQKDDVIRLRFGKWCLAKYRVGQYSFVNFPQISLLEWHPFSLSSGPDEPECEVNIKALGHHTKKIVAEIQSMKNSGKTIWMRVDGP